ncbi:MAG TPA: hypothetical protein DD414_11185 [Lachnospiraceae bacterium]|nr:hypothetical protein [Lachnospiraceae bacterium]
MRKINKKRAVPAILLAVSVALLLLSTVGSTRAALTYYSDNYQMEVTVSSIGVSLMENGERVSYKNYVNNDWVDSGEGKLLTKMLGEGEKFAPGKAYPEALSVTNSGAIDSYVRVIVRKSWTDAEGKTDTALSPDLIDLKLLTDNGWIVDHNASTPERTVLYYTRIVPSQGSTSNVSESLKVDTSVMQETSQSIVSENGDQKVIRTDYRYNGYSFNLDAEVDAVQTHNAKEAIKSAWGVDVNISADGVLSLVQ